MDELDVRRYIMRLITLLIIFSCSFTLCAENNLRNHIGVFSGDNGGFVVKLVVHQGGLASFNNLFMNIIGKWTFDSSISKLSIEYYDYPRMEKRKIDLRFEDKTRSYGVIVSGKESDAVTYDFHYTSDQIPSEIAKEFNEYPERIKKLKAQAQGPIILDKIESRRLKQSSEQNGTGQPVTRPESNSEGSDKPQPGAEGRSR